MNISDMIQELRSPLDRYLDAIEGELLALNVSRVERQCTLADVEVQALTLLQRRVDQGESLNEALLTSILAEMDPPERYGAESGSKSQVNPILETDASRLPEEPASAIASVAASTAVSVTTQPASTACSQEPLEAFAESKPATQVEPSASEGTTHSNHEVRTVTKPMEPDWDVLSFVAFGSVFLAAFLIAIHEVPVAILVAIIATVCGIISIFRIRASDGYLHGLSFAFAAAVTYPIILSVFMSAFTGLWIILVVVGALGMYAAGIYFLWKITVRGYVARPLPQSTRSWFTRLKFPAWKLKTTKS